MVISSASSPKWKQN